MYTETLSEKIFHGVIIFLLLLTVIVTLYPIILVISSSFSSPLEVMANNVKLLPVSPTLAAYRMVFKNTELLPSYINTIKYTSVGTFLNVLATAMCAYPMSRPDLYGKRFFNGLVIITIFFSAGMIPNYLIVKNLGLLNNMFALILPGLVSTWNLLIMRTFFKSTIPMELQESAFIDGANDLCIFFRIIIPLSKPIIAVIALYYSVGHWNSWFSALLYLNDRKKYPLQMILRDILIQSNTGDMSGGNITEMEMIGETIKYSTMVVATLPIMCLYPFLQKYFVKGVMIGSIKG